METRKKMMTAARQSKRKPMVAPPRRMSRVQGGDLAFPALNVEDRTSIDTSLYVGPIYDGSQRRKSAIKEQLGDITQRLHKTLHEFDVLEDFESQGPPTIDILENLTRNIDTMGKSEMKGQLEVVMDQYRELSCSAEESNKEREELLLQVADWFSTDHVDLDDLKSSVNEEEEKELQTNYVNTLADFEKLKSLKDEIIRTEFSGKNKGFLEAERKRLEKSVLEGMKLIKTCSIQKLQTRSDDDSHWKHAAGEVVELLNKVRLENKDERDSLSKRLEEMLKQLERQELTIRQLQGDVRRERNVSAQLAEENTDLTKDITQLRGKLTKYERELESAKEMIEKQFSMLEEEGKRQLSSMKNKQSAASVSDTEGSESTLTTVLTQFIEPKDSSGEMSGNPTLLRTLIRELKENLEIMAKEYSTANEKIQLLEKQNENLAIYLEEYEATNSQLDEKIFQLESDLEYARLQAQKKPAVRTPSPQKCEICEKRISETTEAIISPPKDKSSANLEPMAAQEEIEKLNQRIQSLKKTLYDTELKLSDAYKEIAEMRMMDEGVKTKTPSPPQPSFPTPEPEEEEEDKKSISKAEIEKRTTRAMRAKSPPARKKITPRSRPPPSHRKTVLPPIRKKPGYVTPVEEDVSRSEREVVLYNVGDLQSLLNSIIQDIMDYTTSVGNMIYKDDQEPIAQPTMRTFEFGQRADPLKNKKLNLDPKEAEKKDKKSQVFFLGQRACGIIKEIYELLSTSLNLLHEEFETIYRSFKESQERRAIERAMMTGKMPPTGRLPKQLAAMIKDGQMPQGRNAESLLTYYMLAYNNLQKKKKKDKKGHVLIHTHSHTDSISITSVTSSVETVNNKNLQNAVMVLGIHRSQSDMDIQSVGSAASFTALERTSQTHLFVQGSTNRGLPQELVNREEAKVAMTTVPKKGLIKLTALGEELENPFLFEGQGTKNVNEAEELEHERHKFSKSQKKQKMLIRRKDIQEQVLLGTQQLKEEEKLLEEQDDMEKQLGEYTIGDLHKNLNELTGVKMKSEQQEPQETKVERKLRQKQDKPRSITLPAINTLNLFGS